ncbi:MAG: cation:proton antiporter [Adlercreutzia equolifaciens]
MELALIALACVIGSAVLCQIVPRLSLPLVQIAVGAVVALAVPAVRDVSISSELFLVLFIAPLLFNEARETNPRDLWENKGSILSLAVGLVLLTVLVVGLPMLNWFRCPLSRWPPPSPAPPPWPPPMPPLWAALASSVSLKRRQSTLLAGRVAHQRRVRRCRAFNSPVPPPSPGLSRSLDAAEEFGRLFLGGITAGVVVGVVGLYFPCGPLRRGGCTRAPRINVLATRCSRRSSCTCSPNGSTPPAFWLWWPRASSPARSLSAPHLRLHRPAPAVSSASGASSCSSSQLRWCSFFLACGCPEAFHPGHCRPLLAAAGGSLGVVALSSQRLSWGAASGWVLVMEGGLSRRPSSLAGAARAAGSVEGGNGGDETSTSPTPHLRHRRPHWRERIGSLLSALAYRGGRRRHLLPSSSPCRSTMPDGATPFPERDLIVFLTASASSCARCSWPTACCRCSRRVWRKLPTSRNCPVLPSAFWKAPCASCRPCWPPTKTLSTIRLCA